MTQQDVGSEARLYGMMQHLLTRAAHSRKPDVPAPRNVVTNDDARDAVLQAAAAIDSAVQSGQMPQAQGVHAVAMLMVVREYIQPLPAAPGQDGADQVTPDVEELVGLLRQARGASGFGG